ncbi:MAG: nitrite/sulfite reductase, partial [Elusimicrobia bacterium]|nr:nitrite/sulfite reductase [Elusimicrobiota bacterium]
MPSLADKNEIEDFSQATQLFLRNEIDAETFKKIRLLFGVYSQRQPGRYFVRARVVAGELTSSQLDRIAEIAETYSEGIFHITTRQNLQFYGIPLDQIPAALRSLAEAGITTRETAGNVVRNITVCYLAGVCSKQKFDVSVYAQGLTRALLRSPEFQNLPRKFKISFSGCEDDCALTAIQDLGFIAACRENQDGFKVFIGGGLGAVPRTALLLEDFIPADELLPTTLAVLSLFDRHGNRTVRSQSRLKFLFDKMGIEEFKEKMVREREKLKSKGTLAAENLFTRMEETVTLKNVSENVPEIDLTPEFARWRQTNVQMQEQTGFWIVNVTVPLGDIRSHQVRAVAMIAREFSR